MSAPDGQRNIPPGLVIGYLFFVAIAALIAYRSASVWVGHIVFLALLLPIPLWLVSAKKRRLALAGWLVAAGTLLLGTLFIRFLNVPARAAAIEQNKILNFFLGGVAAKALASILGALALSLGIVFLPLLIVMYISSEWVLHMPEVGDLSRRDIIRLFLAIFFHTGRPYYIVENGEITQTKPKGLLPKIGGPGLVIIKPYNAVVFEQGGKVTRIEGPGRVLTRFMEFPKEVLDLRKQWISWTAENILTKDHVPLRFYCGVGFRIEAAKDTARWLSRPLSEEEGGQFLGIISGDYKVYQHTLYRATYGTTAAGWKLTSQAATESQLLKVVRSYSLEDFYKLKDGGLTTDESIIGEIVQKTLSLVSEISPSWGVTITGFKISHFEAPEEMTDKLLEMWAARYAERSKIIAASAEKEAMIALAEGKRQSLVTEAEGESKALRIKTEARRDSAIVVAEGDREAIVARGEGQAEALARVERVKARAVEMLINQLLRGIREAGQTQPNVEIVQRFARVVEQLSSNLVQDDLTAFRYVEALEKIALSDAPKTIALGNVVLESAVPAFPQKGKEQSG